MRTARQAAESEGWGLRWLVLPCCAVAAAAEPAAASKQLPADAGRTRPGERRLRERASASGRPACGVPDGTPRSPGAAAGAGAAAADLPGRGQCVDLPRRPAALWRAHGRHRARDRRPAHLRRPCSEPGRGLPLRRPPVPPGDRCARGGQGGLRRAGAREHVDPHAGVRALHPLRLPRPRHDPHAAAGTPPLLPRPRTHPCAVPTPALLLAGEAGPGLLELGARRLLRGRGLPLHECPRAQPPHPR